MRKGPISSQHSLRQSSSTFARTSGIFLLSDHQLAVLCLKNGQRVSKDSNFTIFYHISPISNSFTHFSLSSSGITHQKNTKIAILDDVPSPCQKGFQQNWECLGVPNDPPKWKVHTENCLFSSIFWVTAAGKSTIFINLQSRFGDVRYAMVKSHSTKPYKIPLNHSKSY